MARPNVDVIVPFAGPVAERAALERRLARLRLAAGDTLTVVDNGGGPPAEGVVSAAEIRTPAYARNAGARRGERDWIVFFDADADPVDDLLDRYFDPPPGERTALLAGGVVDEPLANGGPVPPAVLFAAIRGRMSQETTLAHGRFAFVQTANCAVRRDAFEAVGGFRDTIRAGEDADLCYRLAAAGWRTERREHASVVHRSRRTVRALVAQAACHGAGAAWLNGAYPGSFPPRRRPGLVWWAVRSGVAELARAARRRDRERAVLAVLDPLTTLAFELGRSLPNERRPR